MSTEPTITYRWPTRDEMALLSLTTFIVRRSGGPMIAAHVGVDGGEIVTMSYETKNITDENYANYEISFDGKKWRPFGTPVERKVVWKCVVEKGMQVRPDSRDELWCVDPNPAGGGILLAHLAEKPHRRHLPNDSVCHWPWESYWRPAFVQVPEGEA